jgi:hypothetical protein
MTTNLQMSPYLPRQRNFPNDNVQALGTELDKSYLEIASRVNERTIGLYAVNFPSITGNKYYINMNSQRQQSLRQLYTFTTTAAIPHGISFPTIDRIVNMYGDFTDGTNWYGLIAGSNVAIAGQISFYLDPTNINFLLGAGAPALTKGNIVIEWLSIN